MASKTFTHAGGGSWETGTNWASPGIPGTNDIALIGTSVVGTYTVTLSAIETPFAVNLNDGTATLLLSSTGQLIGSPLTLNAGTLALDGIINSGTAYDNGATFAPSGGTLVGVTWQGPFTGPANTSATVNISNGLTLLNAAGTGPGTLDIGSLYMVNIQDSTPLDNMTINIDNYNNEYLSGPAAGPLVLGPQAILTQTNNSAGSISGQALTNDGTINATASTSNLFIQSATFNNAGSLTVSGGDRVTVSGFVDNTGPVAISSTGTLNLTTTNNAALSNSNTISTSFSGTFVAGANLAGSGLLTLANFGVDDIYNTSNTTTFMDSKGTLRLEAPTAFTGTITGFQHGDKIDLLKQPVTSLSYAGSSTSGVLTAKNGVSVVATLNLLGNYVTGSTGSPGFQFAFGADSGTGNNITVSYTPATPPRNLVWIGPSGGVLSNVGNWDDTTDNFDPAVWPLNTTDTLVFGANTESVTGVTSVGALTAAGGGAVFITPGANLFASGAITVGTTGAAAVSVNGDAALSGNSAVIANTASGAGSSINVTGTDSTLLVATSMIVGQSATGSLELTAGASGSAATLDAGSAAGGAGIVTISDPNTTFTTTGSFAAGDSGIGEVAILNGATVNIGGDLNIGQLAGGSGVVDVEDSTGTVILGGNINIGIGGGAAELIVGVGAHVQFENGGETVGKLGRLIQHAAFDPLFLNNAGAVTVFSGTTPYLAFANNTGTVTQDAAGDASVIVSPTLYGAGGVWQVNTGGSELTIGADSVTGQTFAFTDNTGTLVLGYDSLATIDTPSSGTGPFTKSANPHLGLRTIGGFGGTIGGFVAGDTIVVDTSAAAGFSLSGSVVSVVNTVGGATEGTLIFANAGMAQSAMNTAGALVAQMACFAAGTRIETAGGMVRVEDLAVGDRVTTCDGDGEPIVWIGQRFVDCARHPNPEAVWPVRVSPGAFGENVPARDLYLSPDHAVFVDGVLVPVKLLINGTSIAQTKRPAITYFHVELPRHAVILAEGLTVESYLDTGDRANFQRESGVMRLFPDFSIPAPDAARLWETAGCAPLVSAGEALAKARAVVVSARATSSQTARNTPPAISALA